MSLRTIATHRYHQWLINTERFEYNWRKSNEENFDYYDGDQWTDEEKYAIESRGQQATVLNVIRPTVDMILALESEKRTNIQVTGREESDGLMAKLLTELLSQVFDYSDKDFYAAKSFREAIIGGRGWVFCRPIIDEDDQVQIVTDWVPWEDVYIDQHHRKPDGSDARYIIMKKWIDRDILKEDFPELADKIDTKYNDDYKGAEYYAQNGESSRIEWFDAQSDRVMICHCWYKDSKGDVKYCLFSEEIFLKGGIEDSENNDDPIGINMFPLIPFSAFMTRKNLPKGLVPMIKDPQDQINKLNSKYLWSICSNRILMEEDAVDDKDAFHAEMQKPDGLAITNAGALMSQKVREESNTRDLNGLINHLQFMLGMIQRTSGINDSMLGYGGVNERSASQQRTRILQGSSVQTQILENFQFTNKRIAKVVLRLIAKYYDDERIIRITQPNGTEEVFTVNQIVGMDPEGEPVLQNEIGDILQYDVILKSVPTFSSTNEVTLQYISELAKSGVFPPQLAGKLALILGDVPGKEDLIFQLEQFYQQQAGAVQQQGGAAPV
jgi:hypothetical protein